MWEFREKTHFGVPFGWYLKGIRRGKTELRWSKLEREAAVLPNMLAQVLGDLFAASDVLFVLFSRQKSVSLWLEGKLHGNTFVSLFLLCPSLLGVLFVFGRITPFRGPLFFLDEAVSFQGPFRPQTSPALRVEPSDNVLCPR